MIRKGSSGYPSCADNAIKRDDVSKKSHRAPDLQHCCGRWGVVADDIGEPMRKADGRAAQSVERRRSETPSGFAGTVASDFTGSILVLSTFGVSTCVATSVCDTEPV